MSDHGHRENGPTPSFWGTLRRSLGFRGSEPSLRESLEEVIEEHEELDPSDALGTDERSMLRNILDASDVRADDIMIPRADIIAFDIADEFNEMVDIFCSAAHSRLPVYRNNLDEVLGMIHVKDVVKRMHEETETAPSASVRGLIRPVLFVSPSMKVIDLLAKMRASRTHMAIVVDEYGGTDGLITIENAVELIVGDIEDEHDEDTPAEIVALDGGRFDVDARVSVDELEDRLGADLLEEDLDEEVDTVGGLVATIEGRVPQSGETVIHDLGYRFEILQADPRRLKKVRVHPPTKSST